MNVSFDLSALNRTKWHEYAVRFLFGGLVTVGAGLIAKKFGPVFGGLFLAFPAIFPAGATLVEKHERKKKERAGIRNTRRGRQAAALDSLGAAQGSLALVCFAIVVWKGFLYTSAPIALGIALVIWIGVATAAWRIRRSHFWT
jgi:Protein of unknown function (DUF3147)